ncbi:MAG: glycosyltransferase family 4 protein [Candidatus Pacearchaeota archaeon]
MKISFATPYYISGMGIENRITELAKNLPKDIEKNILCLDYKRMPKRDIELKRMILPFRFFSAHNLTKYNFISKYITKKYFSLISKSDLIDCQYFPMTLLKAPKKIITWHSVTFPEYALNEKEGRRWNKEFKAMIKDMHKTDLIVPVSKWAEQEVKEHIPNAKTEVIYNGVDLDKFRFKPLELRKKNILVVGRFTPHKGYEEAISIYNEVIKELKDPEINLIMAGRNDNLDYYNKLKIFSKKLVEKQKNQEKEILKNKSGKIKKNKENKIIFFDNLTDTQIMAIYQNADIFVSCSHWEGFGMPLIEAQSCGLPSFAYNICSHPEVIANKNNLANENDIWDIAEKIKILLTDKKKYNLESIKARKFAENFDWKLITQKYLSTIQKI